MKKMVFLLLLLVPAFANATDLATIRRCFYEASLNNAAALRYNELMQRLDTDKNTVLLGYRAMSHFMLAKHAFNPVTKLDEFKQGKKMLEKAIALDKTNIELRYLRLSVQTNVPSFLAYSNNIYEDKIVILNGLRTLHDDDLRKKITDYLLESGHCKNEQLN